MMGVGVQERRRIPDNGDMALPEHKIASAQLVDLV
jgi:hypothetical protein